MMKVSDVARAKIISLLEEKNATVLRFGLQGGGCSGFTYNFSIDEQDVDDIVYDLDGTRKLVVDPMSMSYLEEAELSYKKDLMSESFTIHNPEEKSKCGCGNSFSV